MTAQRRTPHPRILLIAAAVIAIASTIVIRLRPPSLREQLMEMRPGLVLLRDSAETCRDVLERERTAFQAIDQQLNGMRSRITALEGLHADGVPADSYAVYLALVDSFNAAVPGWEPAAATLAEQRSACERIVDRHNRWADSARVLTERINAEERSGGPSPDPDS